MLKYARQLLFFLPFFLSLPSAHSQERINFNKEITEKFLKYCDAVPREEIFVHTDRSEYIAGESLWFNIYLIDRKSNKPSSSSKIAYFELLNSDNRPVVQKRISIKNGFGPGQIDVPDTLSTGRYILRAYTNWMKNFLPVNCFMKEINIYNAISDKTLKGISDSENISGKGTSDINTTGAIEPGFVLKVSNLNSETLEISMNSDENYRSLNNGLCYLFIQTRGIINLTKTVKLPSGNTSIDVPKNILLPGINQIAVFDSRGQLLKERFIYTPVKENNRITLNSAGSYNIRDRVSFEMKLEKEKIASSDLTNLSISVTPKTDNKMNTDIADYMVFGTEFGVIPDEIKNSKINELSPQVLDNFLLTLKSNWIDWSTILSGNVPVFKYKIENGDHFLTGTLINRNSQNSNSEKYVFLSTPGKNAVFQYAKTDTEGNFSLGISINEEIRDLIIQPEETEGNPAIKIESSFSSDYLPEENLKVASEKAIPKYISKYSINYQVSKIYGSFSSDLPSVKPLRFYGKPDIGLVMANYILLPVMEEVFFELLPGVFLKNKKSVYKISIADPATNKIYEKPPVLFVDGVVVNDPSVIASIDPELVEKIDVIRDLYLVGDYFFFGLINVITRAGDYSSVTLPDYAVRMKYSITDPMLSFFSPDYSSAGMKQSRIPDFRNTLYWNPSVKPDVDGKVKIDFWTSDISDEYEVNIQGITPEGKTISLVKIIKVK
jgi:hypothetical protein